MGEQIPLGQLEGQDSLGYYRPTAQTKSCGCRAPSASHQQKIAVLLPSPQRVSQEQFQCLGVQFTPMKADCTQPLAGIDTNGLMSCEALSVQFR